MFLSLARTVAELPLRQDNHPLFEVVVDRALFGEVHPIFCFETMETGGNRKAFLEIFDQFVRELVGHHAPSPLVGLQRAGHPLGQYGGILGIDPAAMDLVFEEYAREPTVQLTLDASLGEPIITGECVHGQGVPAMFEIRIPQAFQSQASFHRPKFPGKWESANIGHVSVLSR